MPFSAIAGATFCTLVWAVSSLFVKVSLEYVDASTFGALRFLSILPIFFFIKKPRTSFLKLFWMSLFWIFFYFLFFNLAFKFGLPPGTVSLIVQTNVLFAVVISVFMFGETLSRTTIAGLIITFTGVFFLTQDRMDTHLSVQGVILALMSAASWGVGYNLLKNTAKDENKFSLSIWISLFALVDFMSLELLTNGTKGLEKAILHPSPVVMIAIIFTGWISSIGAYYIWTRLMAKTPTAKLAPFMLLSPLATLLLSNLLLGEALTPFKIAAACFILSGLAVNQYGDKLPWFRPRVQIPGGSTR